MPFIEVMTPAPLRARTAAAAPALTDALVEAWNISPQIVTTLLCPLGTDSYLHAGVEAPHSARLFVKLHAFRRSKEARAQAAAALTDAFIEAGIPAADVIIYFMERSPDEVAHGGQLQSETL